MLLIKDPEAFEKKHAPVEEEEVKPKPKKTAKTLEDEEGEQEGDEFTTIVKGGKGIVITGDNMFKILQQVLEARGKKVG